MSISRLSRLSQWNSKESFKDQFVFKYLQVLEFYNKIPPHLKKYRNHATTTKQKEEK